MVFRGTWKISMDIIFICRHLFCTGLTPDAPRLDVRDPVLRRVIPLCTRSLGLFARTGGLRLFARPSMNTVQPGGKAKGGKEVIQNEHEQ